MHDSFLAQIWPNLTSDDLRWLKKAVRSPWFNSRADVIRLFDFIYENGPTARKERVFSKVWPNEAYDEARFRYALSFLVQLIRSCLSASEAEADPVREKLLLAAALRRRGLDKWLDQSLTEAASMLEKQPLRHAGFFSQKHELQSEQYRFALKINELERIDLPSLTETFSVQAIAEALRLGCSVRVHQTLTKQAYPFPMLDAALFCLKENPDFEQFLPIKLWLSALRMLDEPDELSHFETLKTLLTSHWQTFPTNEMRDLLRAAINHCIRRQNAGEAAFAGEALDLYQKGLENKVLLEDGKLGRVIFMNILSLALKLDEFDWAADFLEKYGPFLPEKDRENTWRLGSALLAFRKNAYSNVLELLQTVDFTDVFEALSARRMLLRSFYELGAWESLDALLDSFSHFLTRKKSLGYHKENYQNLVRFTRRLVSLNRASAADGRRGFSKKTQTEIGGLRHEIESAAVAEREWLLSKLIS